MVSTQIRDRRRTLRYRHLLVRQMVQMKNRVSGLLLETGVTHNKQRLHKVKYFRELLATNPEVQESIRPLLKLSRESIERFIRPVCSGAMYASVPAIVSGGSGAWRSRGGAEAIPKPVSQTLPDV